MAHSNNVSLENKLKEKLGNGEITQEEYDELMKKFSDLDILGSKVHGRHTHKFSGSKTFEGGEIDEPVKVSGKFISESSLACPSMKVSGSASILGDLSVVESTKISGKLNVKGTAKFGGAFKLSGKTTVGNSAYFTEKAKISGNLQVENEIVSGDYLSISGKLYAKQIKSTSTIKLSGKVYVDEDLVAEEFLTSGGGSKIGGDLRGTTIEIAKKHREKMSQEDYDDDPINTDAGDIESIPDLAKFVTGLVTKIIPNVLANTMGGSFSIPSTFSVGGNIEGKIVDISYTEVQGDVLGDIVKIGPAVVIHGKVKYKERVELPDDSDIAVKQIN